MLLALSVALCVTAYFQMNKPPLFASAAKLSINVENHPVVSGEGSAAQAQDPETALGGIVQIMQVSAEVHQNANDILAAKYPTLPATPVSLDFIAKNTILTITATGTEPRYTQAYLQATIEGYLAYRKKLRNDAENPFFRTINEQLAAVNEKLKQDNSALIQFQHDANKVYGKEDTTSDNLNALRLKRETLQADYDRLKLMTPEQGIDHDGAASASRNAGNAAGGVSATTQIALDLDNTQASYRQALAQIADLRAQLDIFTRDMRETHPKIIALRAAMKTQQSRVDEALAYAAQRIESLRNFTATQLDDLKVKIEAAEPQALKDRVERGAVRAARRDQEARPGHRGKAHQLADFEQHLDQDDAGNDLRHGERLGRLCRPRALGEGDCDGDAPRPRRRGGHPVPGRPHGRPHGHHRRFPDALRRTRPRPDPARR